MNSVALKERLCARYETVGAPDLSVSEVARQFHSKLYGEVLPDIKALDRLSTQSLGESFVMAVRQGG